MIRYAVYSINIIIFLTFLVSVKVQAMQQGVDWTSKPVLLMKRIKNGNRRAETGIKAVNFKPQKVLAYPPSKSLSSPNELKATDDHVLKFKIKKHGNYHYLVAIDAETKSYASTTKYFSRPGPSPRSMLKQHKLPLEIKPVDLPREHRRFRALENWPFQVFYQSKPLADVAVLLETSNGTIAQYQSNQDGIIELTLPNDFKEKKNTGHQHHHNTQKDQTAIKQQHHRRRQSAHFVVSVEHDGMTSAFNYKYSPEAFKNKSIINAIVLVLIGMLAAGFVLYRRKPV